MRLNKPAKTTAVTFLLSEVGKESMTLKTEYDAEAVLTEKD